MGYPSVYLKIFREHNLKEHSQTRLYSFKHWAIQLFKSLRAIQAEAISLEYNEATYF